MKKKNIHLSKRQKKQILLEREVHNLEILSSEEASTIKGGQKEYKPIYVVKKKKLEAIKKKLLPFFPIH